MFASYEQYLKEPKYLTVERMRALQEEILGEIADDTEAMAIYDELIRTATRYAKIRAEWLLWDRITKIENDDSRTSCHNSLIVKFDMLARHLKTRGKDAAWRDVLGYKKDDRKTIGDFACYLVFVNSLNAR
ncbi:MAG: hypothetical protein IJA19_05800 [Clostridia bacterium]|nr:hypothetical protein [Clostridia bacterium]